MNKIWLSKYRSEVPATIDANLYQNLPEFFEKTCQEYRHLPAIRNLGTALSFAQVEQYSRQLAVYLHQHLRLPRGSKIGIMMPNILQFPITFFAALRADLTVININPLYTPRELIALAKDAGLETLIVMANFAHVVEKALPETSLRHIIITEVGDLLGKLKGPFINFVVRHVQRKIPPFSIPNAISFRQALEAAGQQPLNPIPIKSEHLAFLQYTGGTTGTPKGAMLSHRNLLANILQTRAWVGGRFSPGKEQVIAPLPLYHIYSLTVFMALFSVGAETILITNPRDIHHFIKTLLPLQPTIFVGINTLFNALEQQPEFRKIDFSRLHLTIAGGMAVQNVVAERWQKVTGCVITEGYGLTEASPIVTISSLDEKEFLGSIGMPVPSTEIKICNEQGIEVDIGEVGELYVKGPQIMQGYWQQPAATADVLLPGGWLKTGDIARIDTDGRLYLVDRRKDMILVSGFNVYPNEVENVIAAFPGVQEVAVVGIPNEKTGEAVKAFVVRRNKKVTEAALLAYCKENLTGYKIPKMIEFREELPKSTVGKVLRRMLREMG